MAHEDSRHLTLMPSWDAITTPGLAYLRLLGRAAHAYLTGKTVAERARALAAQAEAVHVIFNNNSRDFAPRAAERLQRRLGQTGSAGRTSTQADLL